MPVLLALDQGTTGSTAVVFSPDGSVHARVNEEFTQHYPSPGLVEHDATEIWSVTLKVGRRALQEAGVSPGEVAGLGITNQRETLVVWDRRTGTPLYRALVWQDRRGKDLCHRLRKEGVESEVRAKTGLLLDPYFTATKLRWLLDEVPAVQAAAREGRLCAGTVDSWLLWNLTNGERFATDISNASRTLLCNIDTGEWDPSLLELFGIPEGILPEIRPSSSDFGQCAAEHFGAAIPIGGVAGDQQSALFGHKGVRAGAVKNTYGTGSFLLMHTGPTRPPQVEGVLTTRACQLDGEAPGFALEGSVFVTGAAVQWLRDGLGIIQTAAETQALAESLESNEGVYFVPALAGLGSPWWDPDARGLICGITRGTTRAHMARAALEAIAFQTRDVLDVMQKAARVDVHALGVDGGAVVNRFLMQFQADILECPVHVAPVAETTAMGAAFLAGIQVGVYGGTGDLPESTGDGECYDPTQSANWVARELAGWRSALRRCR